MSRFTGMRHLAFRSGLAATMVALGFLLSGCPEEGVKCGEGLTVCGSACVDLSSTTDNCGACGATCGGAQMCVEGACRACTAGICTYDVVATCFNTGQVVALQADSGIKGPNIQVGDRPLTAAPMQDVLLVVDAAKKLREARMADFATLPEAPATGDAPNHVLVDDPYAYLINSASNTLLVFERKAQPGTLTHGTHFPQGLQLESVASVDFGANTNPFASARLGSELWVTLYGNLGGDVSAGGRVARVNVANPRQPALLSHVPLPSGDPLQPFPGSNPVPTPAGIVAHRGQIYVALNNLDPNTFGPGGPGIVVRISPDGANATYLPLGERCLNAGWLASVGNKLVVSCAGKATYDENFNLVAVENSALALLDEQDAVVDTYPIECPAVSGSTCALPSAGRFAVVGNQILLGDNNAGRIFFVEVSGSKLIGKRTLEPQKPQPILACPRESGFSLVSDVVAIP
jgi:hypothetical protein